MQWVKQYIHRSAAPNHVMSKDNVRYLRYAPDPSAKSKLDIRNAQFTRAASVNIPRLSLTNQGYTVHRDWS
jgi:hypothetical protein